MKLTAKTDDYAVFDEVLEKDKYDAFVKYFCEQDFHKSSGKLEKVWRICDGDFYAGEYRNSLNAPFKDHYDLLHAYVKVLIKDHVPAIVGKEGEDWSNISFRPYIYPQGTRISWHNDAGYAAACIFYCHKNWNPSWGGELMVAKTPNNEGKLVTNYSPDNALSRNNVKPILDYYGFGTYISCLPNRLVFTRGRVWHTINRVDKDAGENLRCSVVGFFHDVKK